MKSWLFSLWLCCAPLFTLAGIVKGKVTDKKGEALSFATVYIEGTTNGTSCNAEGEYQLNIQPGSHMLKCQIIGYKQGSFKLVVTGNETVQHNFALEEQTLEMNEFVLKSTDDPAMYIMRKVVDKRGYYAEHIKAFETGIYLKGVFKTRSTPNRVLGQKVDAADMGLDSNRKGILYLCEEMATYYSKGDKRKTVIHSVRESGEPNGLGFSQFPSVINIYDNNVQIARNIAPRGFISPVADGAFNYYKYKLEGDYQEGDHTIFKIRVIPKRLYEPLFSGVLYIVDNEWSVHSLNLLATKKSNMELLDTMRLEQVYLPLEKDSWVIKQQVLYATLKVLGFDIMGNFVTVYNNQKVNEGIPDSVFNDKIVSVYEKAANKKDTSYWTTARPVPLQEDESRDYVRKDSIRVRYEDPKYRDSMRKRGNRFDPIDFVMGGYSYSGKDEKFNFGTNSIITGMVNYNTIEGINVAPRFWWSQKLDSFHMIYGDVGLRYGFENEHFNAISRVIYRSNARDWIGRYWYTGVEGGKYVYQFNPNNPISPLYNTVATLLFRENYLKLYERWNAAAFVGRSLGNGFRWSAQVGFQQRLPLENTTDFSFVKESTGGFSDNLPEEFSGIGWSKHNAVIAKARISYQPGVTYTQYPDYKAPHGSRMPVFTLSYEKGIPNLLDSKTDFDKWRFGIRDNMNLKLLGTLNYNIAAGGFLNDKWVSIPDLNHINGNQLFVAAAYGESFQFAPYYKYSNAEPMYGEAHVEWHMLGFLTNKIPLFRQMRWYLVAGGNAYYLNDKQNYMEAFVGIDNLGYDNFRVFRLDFVQSWDAYKQAAYGFRLGINTGGAVRVNLGDSGTDW